MVWLTDTQILQNMIVLIAVALSSLLLCLTSLANIKINKLNIKIQDSQNE